MNSLVGCIAKSKAGHDKNEFYIIIKEEENRVTLCNGRNRTLERPKIKSKKHIQPMIKGVDEAIKNKLKANAFVTNEEIKYAIKLITKEEGHVKI